MLWFVVGELQHGSYTGYSRLCPSLSRAMASSNDYIGRHLHHMEQEQLHLFPLIDQHLNDGDWLAIIERLEKQQQSQDEPKLEYYHSFYRKIVNNRSITT